jgi:ubiquinol-cytochrome c reductase cytochrome c1 subunit
MLRYIFAIILASLFATQIWAEALPPVEDIALSKAPIDRSDKESIKRGAKLFANTCISCHTMKYLQYNKVAQEAGITIDKMPINVKTWPYGVTPPDMSLEASVRGVDWIYTYLHSFYKDAARPTGVNNLLVPNTAMPGIISAFQGEQVLVVNKLNLGVINHTIYWYDLVSLTSQGSMSPGQFDDAMTDLVNFLAYAAEPYHEEQHRIGLWVLGFLSILFVLAFLLKKEYWKDVKKRRNE